MKHIATIIIFSFIGVMTTPTWAAGKSMISGMVVENMPSADVVRFVVSPVIANYESRIVCGDDSIRVRFPDVGLDDMEIRYLDTPRGSTLKTVRVVPQVGKKSVLQIHPRGAVLDACDRTSVMSLNGNIVISVALTPSQKHRRKAMFRAREETKEAVAEKIEQEEASVGADETGKPGKKDTPHAPATSGKQMANGSSPDGNETLAGRKKDSSLAGTIFDKSRKPEPVLQTSEELTSQNMKYGAGLLFAALIGFAAWYMKKKRSRFNLDEDSIDILSSKRLSTHQTLMVAKVNGSRFLLAVGDKAVTSLGMIPIEGESESVVATLRTDISNVVKESLSREPRISATPYSEIQDEDNGNSVGNNGGTSNFNSDFQRAIDKIVQERNNPSRAPKSKKQSIEGAGRPTSDIFDSIDSASNVSGLISMARMRATLENQASRNESQYRA
jgi:flagellar biogenesis protein FliO